MEKVSYILHNEFEIKGFHDEYRFLSNFELTPVYFEGLLFPSTENAYMAAKTLDIEDRKLFQDIKPGKAKELGRKIVLRSDWETVKYDVMSSVVFDKFYRNVELRNKLLETGNAYLEETNYWGDRIWGCDESGKGENALGKILMSIRTYWKTYRKTNSATKLF